MLDYSLSHISVNKTLTRFECEHCNSAIQKPNWMNLNAWHSIHAGVFLTSHLLCGERVRLLAKTNELLETVNQRLAAAGEK